MSENGNIYWDVFPKLIRVSISMEQQTIPLSIRGNVFDPVYESSNPEVAEIDELGNVLCGLTPGAAMIMVWFSEDRASVRHVQVEVYGQASEEVPQ
ncbi:MAG TPA: hypothetical protein VM658_13560 [bacterium]|nr:hypothetical protein [bacterium]